MATLRTLNRRRRMRRNEGIVVGVYETDAAGVMRFRYEKAVAGRWQRYSPRGQAGALAAYSAGLGKIEISDAEIDAWVASLDEPPTTQEIDEYVTERMLEAADFPPTETGDFQEFETSGLVRLNDGAR